jgi:hypothetical protein
MQMLPHLPMLHSLQVGEVDDLPLFESDLRTMMLAAPLADFSAPEPHPVKKKTRPQVWQ